MYYALNRYMSYSEALDKMGYLYVRPTNPEHEDWVGRTVKATNSFIETVVFKKLSKEENIRAMLGYVYDPLDEHVPILIVGRVPFSPDDVYDVLLIGGKYGRMVIPFLIVAYDRRLLKIEEYEVDKSVWENFFYKEPVFLELTDGFYIDLNKTVFDETATPTINAPLVLRKEVEVKLEEPEPSKPSKIPFWEDKELLFSIATLLLTVLIIMILCDVASGEFYAILFV